jgi:hypothetical protein
MLKLNELALTDMGRTVWYVPEYGEPEIGILKSWNFDYAFVVYPGNNDDKWTNWQNYTAAATKPEHLTFDNPQK